jgi:hypothetical protein
MASAMVACGVGLDGRFGGLCSASASLIYRCRLRKALKLECQILIRTAELRCRHCRSSSIGWLAVARNVDCSTTLDTPTAV